MQDDPIVAEVRAAGDRIAKKCGYDAGKYIAHLIRKQNAAGAKVVSFARREGRKRTSALKA